ncbi:MAG: hypothetical protein ACE5Z5_10995, partial [Candidatus Bathyarchaeia archaeon]
MEIEVLKFGGSILRDIEGFKRAADMVIKELDRSHLPLCVVSALYGVTDRLIQAVEIAHTDRGFDPDSFMKSLYDEHLRAMPPTERAPSKLSGEFEKLGHALAYIRSSGELNDSAYAFAVSRGESFTSLILSRHLRVRGVDNQCFYGEDLLVTDENCREAVVNLEKTKERVATLLVPCLERQKVPIVAGFAGRSETGRVTILGRGGSDDTAVCIAYCIGVKRVVKYVDEDGIMTVDPKFMEEAKKHHPEVYRGLGDLPPPGVIPYLSYVEASELLREERTRVVHYKVLDPLMKGNILLHIKNIFKPESNGTIIGPEEIHREESYGRPKAISYQRNLYGLRFLPAQSRTPTEVYAKVFEALSKVGVDVRYLSTSGYQISLLMPQTDVERALKALSGLDMAVDVSLIE